MIERAIARQEERGFSMWAVVLRETDVVIGDAGLQLLEGGSEVEFGFRLARPYWGKGYATEAARPVFASVRRR